MVCMKCKVLSSLTLFKKHILLISIVIWSFLCNISFAQQSIKNYVQTSFIQINSMHPDSTNYDDLNAIGGAIGSSSIVMLGEQDHGDAATFLAKTRIIKYLHEKKGFNVLAFESDFFGLNYEPWGNKVANVDSFVKANIFPFWTLCDACENLLYDYIPNSKNSNAPLLLAGIDNQISLKSFFTLLDSIIKKTEIPFGKSRTYADIVLPLLKTRNINTEDTTQLNRINLYFENIKDELLIKLGKNDFWVISIENIISLNNFYKYAKNDYFKSKNIRDSQMAKNLEWLVKCKYPKEKIIVWAHNYHISKYNGHYEDDFLNNAKTMGGIFTNDSAMFTETYILGFTSLQGTSGRLWSKKYDVSKPNKNSFEKWIGNDANYAFVDFKKYNQQTDVIEDFYMSGAVKGSLNPISHLAKWSRIFDGVFYIKDMFPCKEIK